MDFLLDYTIKVTLIFAVAWAATIVLRRRSAALRHMVWAAAILSSLALPVCGVLLPEWHLELPAATLPPVPASQLDGAGTPLAEDDAYARQAHSGAPTALSADQYLLWVWGIGFAVGIFVLVTGTVRLARVARRAHPVTDDHSLAVAARIARGLNVRTPVRFLRSPDAPMLVTWGILRPRVLLPAGSAEWTSNRLRMVLCHEMAHIQRRDWFIQMLGELLRAACWFNPVLWIGCNRLRQESEHACDDLVLKSGIDETEYASELLDLARTLQNSTRSWSPSLAMASPSTLERRFAAMLNPSTDRRSISFRTLSLTLAGTLSVVLPLAAMTRPVTAIQPVQEVVNAPAVRPAPAIPTEVPTAIVQVASAQRQPTSVPAAAPKPRGGLSATVYDPSGKAIQNVVIVISNPEMRSVVTTDASGRFEAGGLPAGAYDIEMHATGFAPFHMESVTVESGHTVNLNLVAVPGTPAAAPTVVPGARPTQLSVGSRVQQTKLINRVQPIYPPNAKQGRIQGAVVLEAVIGVDGIPKSLRVINSDIDPSLARAAVDAVSQWRYAPTEVDGEPIEVATTITTNFAFSTPGAGPGVGQRGGASTASTGLPSAPPTPSHVPPVVYVIGEGVRQPGAFSLSDGKSISVIEALARAQGTATNANVKDAKVIRPVPGGNRVEIAINLGDILNGTTKDIALQADDILYVSGSELKSAASGTLPSTAGQPARVRVGGSVAQANLITRVVPIFPETARINRIQGVVILEAVIGVQGGVESVKVISGHEVFQDAALNAVRQWRYKPILLNGQPVEAVTTVTVNFTLNP